MQLHAIFNSRLTYNWQTIKEKRLRFEASIISTLSQADDFKASNEWLGNNSPEKRILSSGMWLKQGLNKNPLTDDEICELTQLVTVQ